MITQLSPSKIQTNHLNQPTTNYNHSANHNLNQLLKLQLLTSKYSHKIQHINSGLLKSLQTQLQTNQLIVQSHQKPFKLKNHNKLQQTQFQISQINNKKQQIQNQLKKLQHQQFKLHLNQSKYALSQSKINLNQSNLSLSNLSQTINNSSPQRMFRSQLTEQQKQKIKSVIQAQKNFIKQIKVKQKQYYDQLQQDRKKNIEAQQMIKKQKCEQRKKYWQKIRQQINQRQQQRKIKYQQEQSRLQSVKKSKKLYQVLQNSWNHKIAQDQNLIKQATQHMRLNHKFDLNKILQHQKQYQKIAKQKQQTRLHHLNQFKDKVKLTLPKIPNSKFFTTLKQQQKRKKQQQEEKQKKKLQLNQKKYQFSKKVKEHYKPKIDESSRNNLLMTLQQDKVDKKQGLPLGQIRNIGNDYMRQIHKNVAMVKQAKGQNSKVTQVQQIKKPIHKNYLVELKQKRSEQATKISLTNEVEKIMKNTSYSASQKIQRAKLVAKRLESKENTKSSALISSINQKMKILRVLNQN